MAKNGSMNFPCTLWSALKNLIDEQGFEHSSSIAYSSLLSLFPFIIFLVSLAGMLGNEHTASDILAYAFNYLPANVVETLQPIIEEVLSKQKPSFLTIGALGALWAAASALETLRGALNRAYATEDPQPFWKKRLQGVLMVLLTGLGAIIMFITIIGGPIVSTIYETYFKGSELVILLWNIIRYFIGIGVIMLMNCIIYLKIPYLRQRWRDVFPGALISSILWIITATLFTWLVASMTDYSKTYGSLGGIITTLLFFQLSAFIFILGAEYNALRLGRK